MSKELRHRLIRCTMSNMVAAAFLPPFNRRPYNNEILEMAKSLLLKYPCLKDDNDSPVSKRNYLIEIIFCAHKGSRIFCQTLLYKNKF